MRTRTYLETLHQKLGQMSCSGQSGEALSLEETAAQCIEKLKPFQNVQTGKLIVFGNGGSAAIASHTAVDYMKNGRIPTMSFNEGSILTCYGNDYGYENVFVEPLKQVLSAGDFVVAISSSGQSENILRAAKYTREKGAFLLTLSGFKAENPLRQLGHLNLYTPSLDYGYVELSHQIFLHMVLDLLMEADHD